MTPCRFVSSWIFIAVKVSSRMQINPIQILTTCLSKKNSVVWDVAPCRSCVNRHPSETSVHPRCTRRHIPEDGILHSHRRENLKCYMFTYDCCWNCHHIQYSRVVSALRILPAETLPVCFASLVCAMCPMHLILLISLLPLFEEEYKLWTCLPVISSLLSTRISLS
jgi:hypothetical protein